MFISMNDANNFYQTVEKTNNILIVAVFYAEWCGACQKALPKVENLAREFTNVKFIKLNIDENDELANDFNVQSVPTFILFYNNQYYEPIRGDVDGLKSTIIQHFNNY
jgi:thioredoxin 1